MEHSIIINNINELSAAAKEITHLLKEHKIVLFYGEMGTGKTTFIKAICNELGVMDSISSPTFSIVNEYHTSTAEKIYHFDFYRIKSIEEAYDLGYEEYFYSNAYCFIEWPEKITELLPANCLKITITKNAEQRIISY